jgi:hypothetical protein
VIALWLLAAATAARCARLERQVRRQRARLESIADGEHELRGALTAFGFGIERLGRDPGARRIAWSLGSELERARSALDDLAASRAPAVRREPLALDRLVRAAAAAWGAAAQRGGRRVELDWRAGPVSVVADRGRLAQALGNVLSNALEHGSGPIRVMARRSGRRVRLEVVNALPRGAPGTGGAAALGEATAGGAAAAPGEATAGGAAAAPGGAAGAGRGRGLRIAARAVESCGGTLSVSRDHARVAAAIELPLGP